jgi:ABC-2 type transport system permease protein
MSLDSAAPYQEWDDEYSALRGNLNTFFNMAIMMVCAAVVAILGILIYEIIKLPIVVYYVIIFVILAAVTVRLLMIGPRKIVENLEKL